MSAQGKEILPDGPESRHYACGWGRGDESLMPLIEDRGEIMASDLLHADDTPIRVLDRSKSDKGLGKGVRKGRIWAYVRDQRPWAGKAPPGAVYQFAPDWKEDHVLGHLGQAGGILQADGYKGYAKLYATDWRARAGSARPPAGRICAVTSMMSGLRQSPKSRARRSTGSASSTTSSAPSAASLPSCGWPCDRRIPGRRSTPSGTGPKSS